MKKGFTLAEVLITLAVIGVVAALTIPVLVNKYQKKQMYTQFMKAYNTIAKAMDNAVAEYGEIDTWKWGNWGTNEETGKYELVGGDDPIGKYVFSSLKVVKTCDGFSDCFASDYTYLDGGDGADEDYPDETLTSELPEYAEHHAVVLADGTVIAADGSGHEITFVIDTNGKKAPNVMGRDLFIFSYETEDEYYNIPAGLRLPEYDPNGEYGDNCNSAEESESDNGIGCAARMLQEGAMNY